MLCLLSGTQSCQLVPSFIEGWSRLEYSFVCYAYCQPKAVNWCPLWFKSGVQQVIVHLCVLCPLSGTRSCHLVASFIKPGAGWSVLCLLSGTQSCHMVASFIKPGADWSVLCLLSGTQSCHLVASFIKPGAGWSVLCLLSGISLFLINPVEVTSAVLAH